MEVCKVHTAATAVGYSAAQAFFFIFIVTAIADSNDGDSARHSKIEEISNKQTEEKGVDGQTLVGSFVDENFGTLDAQPHKCLIENLDMVITSGEFVMMLLWALLFVLIACPLNLVTSNFVALSIQVVPPTPLFLFLYFFSSFLHVAQKRYM